METIGPLLNRMRDGDASALGVLVDRLYDDLRRMAAGRLRGERPEHTLRTTALVHEAYLKLAGQPQQQFLDRGHFLAVASRAMRQVLVDYARARSTAKRGGSNAIGGLELELISLGQGESGHAIDQATLLDLDKAVDELAAEDTRLAELVEMHYFGGMTAEEAAGMMGISVHVARRDLRLAQAWLRRKLKQT